MKLFNKVIVKEISSYLLIDLFIYGRQCYANHADIIKSAFLLSNKIILLFKECDLITDEKIELYKEESKHMAENYISHLKKSGYFEKIKENLQLIQSNKLKNKIDTDDDEFPN